MQGLPPPLPPLLRDQRQIDTGHLRLLAIFHFVFAGLAVLGIGLMFLQYQMMQTFINDPKMMQPMQMHGAPPPKAFFDMFKWFFVIFGAIAVLVSVFNLISGVFLTQHRHRLFSLIVAGLDCLQIPFGTVLGIFTIMTLVRESVVELYEHQLRCTASSSAIPPPPHYFQ